MIKIYCKDKVCVSPTSTLIQVIPNIGNCDDHPSLINFSYLFEYLSDIMDDTLGVEDIMDTPEHEDKYKYTEEEVVNIVNSMLLVGVTKYLGGGTDL